MDSNDNMDCFGVYALVWEREDKRDVYIGSTRYSFYMRRAHHLCDFRHNKHKNMHMQNLYNKYGEPVLQILEICSDKTTVHEHEQSWINRYGLDNLLNCGPALPCPAFGRKMSDEYKAKMSARLKGVKFTEEHRARIALASIGNKSNTGRKGFKFSDESRAKMSVARKARITTDEARANMAKAQTGRTHTNETREKMSASAKLIWEQRKKTKLQSSE